MPLHFDGYQKARDTVAAMDEAQLLSQIDALFGRGNLPEDYTLDDLRREALRQTDIEWTDERSPEYELREFWLKVAAAQRR